MSTNREPSGESPETGLKTPKGSMVKPPIVANIEGRVAKIAQRTGTAAEVILAVLDKAWASDDPRQVASRLKTLYGVQLSQEEVDEYGRWRASEPSESSRGTGGGSEAGVGLVEAQPTGFPQSPYQVDDEEIFRVLERQLRLMMEEAMANPSSDAAKMLEILAFRQLLMDRTKAHEVDIVKFYGEQSKRKVAEARLIEAQTTVRQVKGEVEEAQADGRSFDYQKAFDQISAVIGLGQPLAEPAAPQLTSEGIA